MYGYTIYLRKTEVRTKGGFRTLSEAISAAEREDIAENESIEIFKKIRR